MDKRIRNFILYGLFLLILLAFTFTPLIGKNVLWKPENNKVVPFSGIYFDIPTNINNLKISRSETQSISGDLISYDVEFEYTGVDSSMRIIGKLGEQAFFGDTVVPRHSKATLKGEYDAINTKLFDEELKNGDLYKKVDDYKFISTSEIRVPLSESVKDYKFRISYEPKKLVYSESNLISKMSVFLTNARVDNFTDTEYSLKSETKSFNESAMYVNVLEMYNEDSISSINFWKNVNNVIFILSIIFMLALIWLNRVNSPYIGILAMFVSALTIYRFAEYGVTTRAALIVFPIIGVASVIIGRLISKDKIVFNKYDLSQSLAGAILMFILGTIIYLIPKLF